MKTLTTLTVLAATLSFAATSDAGYGPSYQRGVSLVRLYKNGDVWKESTRFGRDDLLLVAKAADAAHSWIFDDARNGDGPE